MSTILQQLDDRFEWIQSSIDSEVLASTTKSELQQLSDRILWLSPFECDLTIYLDLMLQRNAITIDEAEAKCRLLCS